MVWNRTVMLLKFPQLLEKLEITCNDIVSFKYIKLKFMEYDNAIGFHFDT